MPRQFYVYIVTNRPNGTLYVGVTNDLARRMAEHVSGDCEFTFKYNLNRLVYFEATRYIRNALAREKQIKRWRREKRVALIESINPAWRDLLHSL